MMTKKKKCNCAPNYMVNAVGSGKERDQQGLENPGRLPGGRARACQKYLTPGRTCREKGCFISLVEFSV
jgi:hypothetical protein